MAMDMEAQAVKTAAATQQWPKGGEPMGDYEHTMLHGHEIGFQIAALALIGDLVARSRSNG